MHAILMIHILVSREKDKSVRTFQETFAQAEMAFPRN